jgi:hypothetical protein
MTTRRIHHFEDEPYTMSWVPEAVLNSYWTEHPDWIQDDASYCVEPDGRSVRFVLHPKPGEPVAIEYRVYATKEEFAADFDRLARTGDVLLLDVMTIDPNGRINPSGLDLLEKARLKLSLESIYFVTGYPRELFSNSSQAALRRLPQGHILAKPVDAGALVHELVKKMDIT